MKARIQQAETEAELEVLDELAVANLITACKYDDRLSTLVLEGKI